MQTEQVELICKQCGQPFIGHHNALYCDSCKAELAKNHSHQNWEKAKTQRDINMSRRFGRRIGIGEIEALDRKFAGEMGKTVCGFRIWKLSNEDEYKQLLKEAGYVIRKTFLYKDFESVNISLPHA